jgi:MFS transporter, ACS family, tartrate transporter
MHNTLHCDWPARSLGTSNVASASGLAADAKETALFRKIAWRLMPLLFVGFLLNYVDRNNIGFAALQMNQEINLSPAEFGFGAGVLYLAYCAFEVPSNLALYRFGARQWLGRIVISWGVLAACCALIAGPRSFYALRTLLGLTEAGFFPGAAYLIMQWFPADRHARMLAILLLGIPIGSAIGGPLSGALLELNSLGGLSGWRWMFIIEGLPAVALGLVILRIVADRPAAATWLTIEERLIVEDRIASDSVRHELSHFWMALRDKRVLLLALIHFGFTTGSLGVGIWLPQILKPAFNSNLTIGFVSAAPYVVASISMLVWARSVDRRGRRSSDLIVACGMAAGGLLLSIVFEAFWLSFFWLTVALIGITSARAILWTIPSRFLSGTGAAGGMAFINATGVLGGFVGPAMMGWFKDSTGSFSAGLTAMGTCLLVATALAAVIGTMVPREGGEVA